MNNYPFKHPIHDEHGPFDHSHANLNPRDPYSIESTKITEITDLFGHTRYKVLLVQAFPNLHPSLVKDGDKHTTSGTCQHDILDDDLRKNDRAFKIEVWCFILDADPVVVYESEPIEDYSKALKTFELKVDAYKAYVKAETKDVQNIWLYSDKIDYRIVDPDCCANCEFSKPVANQGDIYSRHKIGKLECTNECIYHINNDFNHDRKCIHNEDHGHHQSRGHYLPVHTEVDNNGICKFYHRKRRPHHGPHHSK